MTAAKNGRPPGKNRTGPASTVEQHDKFELIEVALANDVSLTAIARTYGLNVSALSRYRKRMSAERITLLRYPDEPEPLDIEGLKRSEAQSIVTRNIWMMKQLRQLYSLTAEAGDPVKASRVAEVYRRYIETQARILGEITDGARTVNINYLNSPIFTGMFDLIMDWAATLNQPELVASLARFLESKKHELALLTSTAAPAKVNGAIDVTPEAVPDAAV